MRTYGASDGGRRYGGKEGPVTSDREEGCHLNGVIQ